MRTHFIALFLISLALMACQNPNMSSRPADGTFDRTGRQQQPLETQTLGTVSGRDSILAGQPQQPAMGAADGKVAILLPLSGPQSDIGQAMLQSAQLAVFDMNEPAFELLPFDTQSTPQGASQAVQQAAEQNVKLILGPLLANNVSAAGVAARPYNLNLIGFTTDWTKAGGHIMTVGILPFDQGSRLAQYANSQGKKRVAIVSDGGAYSNAVISAFQQAARQYGIQIVTTVTNSTVAQLAAQQNNIDAVLIPTGGQDAINTANQLAGLGFKNPNTLWMGTGLWDTAQIKQSQVMNGAIFAAPDEAARRSYENKYRSLYGQTPPRLGSLAYDATALAIVLLKQNQTITKQAITNPNGFSGIDGIFRIQENGLAQRGLAIHRITGNGQSVVVDQAPKSF